MTRVPAPDWVVFPLTERQRAIMEGIAAFIRRNKHSPTLKEMADQFGTKEPAMYGHWIQLERKGYIERMPGVARGLRVLKQPAPARPKAKK